MRPIARMMLTPVAILLAILFLIGRRFVNDPMLFILGGGVIFLIAYWLG